MKGAQTPLTITITRRDPRSSHTGHGQAATLTASEKLQRQDEGLQGVATKPSAPKRDVFTENFHLPADGTEKQRHAS